MPIFSAAQLARIGCQILERSGVNNDEATIVMTELLEANLVGHDSHGVIRLKQYVDSLVAGEIKPGAKIQTVLSTPGMTIIDGGFNFGQVVVSQSLQIAQEEALKNGTHTIFCRNTNHVGRLGSYTRKAALEGFATLMAVNGPANFSVIPWGGLEPRLGTNPISLSAPWNDEPLVLDMTTSATAEGKIRVASQAGELIPEGLIVDEHGQAATDPNAFYQGGAILPFGGALGFKGYGLGVMLDIFCGVLSGAGVAREDVTQSTNGVWMQLINIKEMSSAHDYDSMMSRYVAWIKSSRTAPGVREILLPGEIESQQRKRHMEMGLSLSDGTWNTIRELANSLHVALPD